VVKCVVRENLAILTRIPVKRVRGSAEKEMAAAKCSRERVGTVKFRHLHYTPVVEDEQLHDLVDFVTQEQDRLRQADHHGVRGSGRHLELVDDVAAGDRVVLDLLEPSAVRPDEVGQVRAPELQGFSAQEGYGVEQDGSIIDEIRSEAHEPTGREVRHLVPTARADVQREDLRGILTVRTGPVVRQSDRTTVRADGIVATFNLEKPA